MPCPWKLAALLKIFKFATHAKMFSVRWTATGGSALLQMFLLPMNARIGVEDEMITWVTVDI